MFTLTGSAVSFGPHVAPSGINFAVFSTADAAELELFANVTDDEPLRILRMNKCRDDSNTGNVFHLFVPGLPNGTLYNIRVNGRRLIDPYAPALSGKPEPDALGGLRPPKCVAYRSNFDWRGDSHPDTPLSDSIIYELLIPGFTGHPSAQCAGMSGTYRGLIAKIPYLKDLGITAVELMPHVEFDPWDCMAVDPATGVRLTNSWGYNSVAFFAPNGDHAYWGQMGQQVDEFKLMVRELHRHNIEVILDMVLNHTREGNHLGPVLSMKGLANQVYYHLMPDGMHYNDWTGCGNTMNCNHPVVMRFIIDCLRWWVSEFHVDGFRFDLAAVFAVDADGKERGEKTPIIRAIEDDPVLRGRKLIAEPWSCRQYLLGPVFRPRWAQWQDRQGRDAFRKWVKGDAGSINDLAAALHQTGDIGFVACHDGFTAMDLVSYNNKHNEANGEGNRDGTNDNHSWNCGCEGALAEAPLNEDEKAAIEALRRRQVKNLFALLLCGKMTPMILYGDEAGRSARGNNNTVFQESLNQLNWDLMRINADILRFVRMMIALRKRYLLNQKRSVTWHGVLPGAPDWGSESRLLAMTFEASCDSESPVYVATNSYWGELVVTLPVVAGRRWHRLVDTSLEPNQDIVTDDEAPLVAGTFTIKPRSTVILVAR